MGSGRAVVAFVMAVALSLGGCGVFGKDLDRWGGPLSDLRMHWVADPDIDLLRGPAVPVRAYIESVTLARDMGSLDYAYPGFTRAVEDNAPADSPDIAARQRRPDVDHEISGPLVGNQTYRILSVQSSGKDVTATLCSYTYAVAREQENGSYASVARGQSEPRGIFAERVRLVAPAEEVELPPQEGPDPAPGDDVFGGWRITGYLYAGQSIIGDAFTAAWPTYEADTTACAEKAPDPPERRAFLIEGAHPRSDFPTTPATPGWP